MSVLLSMTDYLQTLTVSEIIPEFRRKINISFFGSVLVGTVSMTSSRVVEFYITDF